MAAGGERVIPSLLSMPRLTVKAYISVLPEAIRQRIKDDAYKEYVAECLRIIGENTAKYSGGGYIKVKYSEIINPKPHETRTSKEIIQIIKDKLVSLGGDTPEFI